MLRQKKCEIAVGGIGFGAVVTQTIFLRECLSLFNGNELTIGIVLANWMVLTGIGAYVRKWVARDESHTDVPSPSHEVWGMVERSRYRSIFLILTLLSIIPLATIFIIDYSRNFFFSTGTMIEASSSFIVSFLMLMPYCTLSGYAFTLCAQTLSDHYARNTIARTYSLEASGSVVGGILLNFLLLVYCSTSQALLIIAFLMLGVVFLLASGTPHRVFKYSSVGLMILCAGLLFSVDLDKMMKGFIFQGQEVIIHRDTPYGTITVTSQENQKNIFENGVLLWSVDDIPTAEEAVHYAMVQHPRPRMVLLISGGISGIPAEILKYDITRIDYVELNPWLIDIGRSLIPPVQDDRLRIISTDARRFVRAPGDHYDVVLINVPDPSTAQINRYYTVEFFRELKERLTPGAVISLGVHASADYFNPEAIALYSTIVSTLHERFTHVLIVPGSKIFFLASDNPLSIEIARLIDRRAIPTEYVNRYYIDDASNRERSDGITGRLDPGAPLNTDFTPVAYYRQLQYWLSYSNVTIWIPVCVVLVILGFILRRLNVVSFGILTTGFAATGIEVLLLFSFQILYGIMYQATGFIIAVFMAGLALGSWYAQQRIREPSFSLFKRIQWMIALTAVVIPGVLLLLREIHFGTMMIYCIFIIITMVVSVLIGAQFSIAVRLLRGTTAHVSSTLYSVDLLGSAIGAIGVSVVLIPIAGITGAFFVVALLIVLSAVVSSSGKNIQSGSFNPRGSNV